MYPQSCSFLLNVVKCFILEQSSYVPRCNFQSRIIAHSSWMTIWYHLSHVTVPTGRGNSVRISIHAVSVIICICVGHDVLGMIQQWFPIAFCQIFFYWFTPTDSSPYWAVLATVVNISASSGDETKNMRHIHMYTSL